MHVVPVSSSPGVPSRVEAMVDTLGLDGVYRDPLWRVEVVLSELEQQLLRTWWVRRLGSVAHAGAAALCTVQTYSRLEHSLGLLALVTHFSPDDQLARAAALVHDVGHSPFSHSLEGVAGVDHHVLGAQRIGELDSVLRDHGFDAAQVLDVVDGVVGSPLVDARGAMKLDHLESFVRSGHTHGRTREMPASTLQRLRLSAGAVDTDPATAKYLLDLVAGEARSHCSPLNLIAIAVLRHLTERVLIGATCSERDQVAAMTDDQLLALLLGDERSATEMRLLRADPTAWSLAAGAESPTGTHGAEESIAIDVRRLYLTLPLVEGNPMNPEQPAFASLPPTPARFTVHRVRKV